MPSNREGRTPTTFWFDEEIKKRSKEKARVLNMTMTDLINNAVDYYVDHLAEIDPKTAMLEVGQEIRDTPRINLLEQEIKNLKDRLQLMNNVESDVGGLRNDIEMMKDQIDGEYLQSIIRTHIDSKVGATLVHLESVLAKLQGLIEF